MSENRYNCRMFIDFRGGSEYILSDVELLGPHCSGQLVSLILPQTNKNTPTSFSQLFLFIVQ